MSRAIALIDGNSFYCSCERVFDPKLAGVPVIVLPNNNGCAIARTAEATALGIQMSKPYFKICEIYRRQKVRIFSSNHALLDNYIVKQSEYASIYSNYAHYLIKCVCKYRKISKRSNSVESRIES